MLVLTRKLNESIRIGNDVIVTVTSLAGGRVRIGITAPADLPVFRSELLAGGRVTGNSGCSCEQQPQAVADSNSVYIPAPLKEAAAASAEAAAALLKGLTDAGVSSTEAARLIERYPADRIVKTLAQRQAAIESGRPIGAGLVHAAIVRGEEITSRRNNAVVATERSNG